ncbi:MULTISPECIES: porin [unclassified Vibrio]|jgi:predicted porin|uniref:porin n=1 Tax=unclassified Vibrio TaxID=2614977 RepID=UPI003551CA2C
MKKTLLALSVMFAATSAQAIEIYNQEDLSVNLSGDIEVVYVKGFAKDSEFQQEIQDADFGFDVRYALNDELTFGGYWEFDGASGEVTGGSSTSADVGDVYVALYTQNYGSVKVGRTCGALDDAGVGSDYQFGVSSFFENGSEFCQDEMIRYDIDTGTFYATASLAQDENDSTDALGKDGAYYDLKLGGRVADFDFTAYYGYAELEKMAPGADDAIWALEARFSGVESLNLELGYYATTMDTGVVKVDADTIAFAADYTIDAVTIGAGYSTSDSDNNDNDADNWFVNAGYGFAPNTTAYIEVGGTDQKNTDTGVAVGVKASF